MIMMIVRIMMMMVMMMMTMMMTIMMIILMMLIMIIIIVIVIVDIIIIIIIIVKVKVAWISVQVSINEDAFQNVSQASPTLTVVPDHSSSSPVNSLSITSPVGDSICRSSECKASVLPLY